MKTSLRDQLKRIGSFLLRRPLTAFIIIAVIIGAIICLTLISCSPHVSKSHVTGSGLSLDSGYWKTDASGRKYYDKSGYVSIPGIDISQWTGTVDFRQVKESGVEFVILRVGYRGYDKGGLVPDENLKTYLKDASRVGLKLGAYFVSQAIDEEEAKEEADYVISQIKGYSMEMPLYIDLEMTREEARTDHLSREERTRIAAAFCERAEEQGYRGGIYANRTWFTNYLNLNQLKKYDIWLADYSEVPYEGMDLNMWQYSADGIVTGASVQVDLNTRIELDLPDTETTSQK